MMWVPDKYSRLRELLTLVSMAYGIIRYKTRWRSTSAHVYLRNLSAKYWIDRLFYRYANDAYHTRKAAFEATWIALDTIEDAKKIGIYDDVVDLRKRHIERNRAT